MSHSGNTNDATLYNESHYGNTTTTVGTCPGQVYEMRFYTPRNHSP